MPNVVMFALCVVCDDVRIFNGIDERVRFVKEVRLVDHWECSVCDHLWREGDEIVPPPKAVPSWVG